MKQQIYLDNSATTPVHPLVMEKMNLFLTERYGNPSSIHGIGKKAKVPLEDARAYVAKALKTIPPRIVFTSGGTEADFLAVVGIALANQEKGKHIIISDIEHSAVIEATKFLTGFGFEITSLSVNHHGKIDIEELKQAIREDTILISIIHVNNEIGTIQPIEEIGTLAREKGIYFHTDAVQSFPILDVSVDKLTVDLLSISAHKINGPKGVGALYIRDGINIQPILGGSQERKRRGGTENVPGIIGLGEAVRILMIKRAEKYQLFSDFKEKMIQTWQEMIGEDSFVMNGHPTDNVPSILNVSFPGVDTHTLMMALDMKGIAVSGGSACSSGSLSVSRVIKALNLPKEIAASAIRISFGLGNTEEEVIKAAKEIGHIVKSKQKK